MSFELRKPFSSSRAMLIFGTGLLLLLISPFLVSVFFSTEKSEIWRSSGMENGYYSFIADEMQKDEPIDVLILGSSSEWTSLNPAIIENYLDEAHNREFNVLNLSTNWHATELRFFMLKDILEKREVKVVLFGQNGAGTDVAPHPLLISSFIYPDYDEHLSDLSALNRFRLYSISVFGSFKHIVNFLVRRNNYTVLQPNPVRNVPPEMLEKYKGYNWGNPGFISSLDASLQYENSGVSPERVPKFDPQSMFYNNEDDEYFEEMKGLTYSRYNSIFIKEMDKICKDYGTKFAMIRIPIPMNDFTRDSLLLSKSRILRLFGDEDYTFPFIGASQERLYQNLSRLEVFRLHNNESHHAEFGADYYTLAMMPAINELYEQSISN